MTAQASRVAPISTRAMDAFLAAPVQLHGVDARTIVTDASRARYDATRDRRRRIEGMLNRLEDLRQSLIGKLDALDGDCDFEPYLGGGDDREDDADAEPSLSASERLNQRHWSAGGAHDLDRDHDGREPDEGA